MEMKKTILLIIGLVLEGGINEVCFGAYSTYFRTGTTAAPFLKIGVGGRAIGMGEAYVGLANDVSAIYWNPAGLSQLKRKEFEAMHNFYFGRISHDFLGYAHPLGKGRTIGFGIVGLFVGDLERRSELSSPLKTEGSFGASDYAAIFSYSQMLTERFSGGVSLKVIHQSIDRRRGIGVAVDIGGLYRTGIEGFNLGFGFQNIGTNMKIYKRSFPLPFAMRAGISWSLLEGKFVVTMDVSKPIDNVVSLHFGSEYRFMKFLTLRGGYRYKFDDIQEDPLTGFVGGAGLDIGQYQLNLTYTPYKELGESYRVSLIIKFGRNR
jgi:hypothetical protein